MLILNTSPYVRYRDPYGQVCATWLSLGCEQAPLMLGFTVTQQRELMVRCSVTCGQCPDVTTGTEPATTVSTVDATTSAESQGGSSDITSESSFIMLPLAAFVICLSLAVFAYTSRWSSNANFDKMSHTSDMDLPFTMNKNVSFARCSSVHPLSNVPFDLIFRASYAMCRSLCCPF